MKTTAVAGVLGREVVGRGEAGNPPWEKVLRLLAVNRSRQRISSARAEVRPRCLAELLEGNFAVAEKDRLYRCLDRLLKRKPALFPHLRQLDEVADGRSDAHRSGAIFTGHSTSYVTLHFCLTKLTRYNYKSERRSGRKADSSRRTGKQSGRRGPISSKHSAGGTHEN